MKKKITIKKMTSKEIDTKKGKAEKIGLCVAGPKGDTWINGFASATTRSWKEGDTVEVEVYQSEYNGKQYWNFKAPRIEELIFAELQEIKALLKGTNGSKLKTQETEPLPEPPDYEPEQDGEDLPF